MPGMIMPGITSIRLIQATNAIAALKPFRRLTSFDRMPRAAPPGLKAGPFLSSRQRPVKLLPNSSRETLREPMPGSLR